MAFLKNPSDIGVLRQHEASWALRCVSAGSHSQETAMANSIILGRHHFLHVEIRRVSAMRAVEWLRRGWDDVMHMKAASLGHGALITALGAILLMLGSSHAYLVAAAISGYLLVGPIMTTGLCELSRRRANGEKTGFDESLQG